jgi:hypothetical protein
MEGAVRLIATITVGLGLALILWRELSAADDRRTVGPARDVIEVLLPLVATVALLTWVWV